MMGRLARSGAWNIAAFAVTSVSALAISIIIARSLGPGSFGQYSYLVWVLRTAGTLGAVGIPAAVARMVPEYLGAGDEGSARGIYRTAFSAQVLLAPLLGGLTAAIVWVRVQDVLIAGLLGIAAVSLAMAYMFEQSFAGFRRFDLAARNALVVALVQVSVLLLAAVMGATLKEFLLLQGFVALVGASFWAFATHGLFKKYSHRRVGKDAITRLAKYAAIGAVVVVSDTVLWGRPEVYFLDRFWSPGLVGLYSASLVLATLTSSLPLIASRVLTPEFSWLRGGGRVEVLREAFPSLTTVIGLFAIPLGIGGAFVARDLLKTAYGSDYLGAATAGAILMAGSVFVSVAGPASSAIITGPNPGFMAKLAAGFAAVNISLDFLLIPRWGMVGAATATIASQALSIVLMFRYVSKRLDLQVPLGKLAKLALVAVASSWAARNLAGPRLGLAALAVAVPVAALAYVGLAFGLRIVSWQVLVQLMKKPTNSKDRSAIQTPEG